MKELLLYLFIFIFVYLFYFIFVYKRENVFKKFKSGKEISYLKYKYKVKVNNSNIKKLAHIIFLSNSFILSSTVTVVSLIDNMVLEIIVGMVVLLVLILLIYHIIGKTFGGK